LCANVAILLIRVIMISAGVLIGSWWYGKWVWVDYNFFKV